MPKINKTYLIAGVVILIIAAVWYNNSTKTQTAAYSTATAEIKTITQEVSVTGKIKPANSIDLSFERSGKINNIYAEIGDKVKTGQSLASIDNEEILANLSGAKAQLDGANAKLDELTRGARPEEIKISETAVANAQKSLADQETNLINIQTTADINLANLYGKAKDILNDGYAKAYNSINTQIADLFFNAATSNPLLTFTTTDSQAKTDSETQRVMAGASLKTLKSETDNLPSDYPGIDNSLTASKNQLIVMRDFLTRLSAAVNSAAGLTSTALDTYKSSVNTAWTNINTAITNINNQEQLIASQKISNKNSIDSAQKEVNDAQNALRSAEDSLALKKAGTAPEQIDAQKAQVKQAEAQIKNYEIQQNQSTIKSPISGIVTKQEAKIGKNISANAIIISVISEAKFQIETNIPEADIAKIKIDDPAKITLDAYGNDIIFEAKIISIDPAETIIEGVSTYKATLEFTKEDDHIRSGMTANIDILTAKKENIIAIPQRTIITKDGQKLVLIDLGNGNQEERKIETGLRGSDGNIEIISGLKAGEKVIISVTE
ncbi:efflux RND transporter periplasmic adaptor subunit [Patescibacteria group bacterium]|nr:efflux RND transporter periplasmic adaptor subunit [Patescibacteria group bacterium]MBU4580339.1 efflux RND transporter periplasmic adaptor subunit [Patescibacteria group bacterium]